MTRFLLPILVFSTFVFSSCKKSKAEKSIRGAWFIYEYQLSVFDECNQQILLIGNQGNVNGSAVFERKTFALNINISDENTSCYLTNYAIGGDWNIDDHDRSYLIHHTYSTSLDANTWLLEFYGEPQGFGQKADYQEFIQFSRVNEYGFEEYILLRRIP